MLLFINIIHILNTLFKYKISIKEEYNLYDLVRLNEYSLLNLNQLA